MTKFMYFYPKALTIILCLFSLQNFLLAETKDRIPFYEDYLKDSNFEGFLVDARKFLEENPNAIEAPRLAQDYLMTAKASRDIEAISFATSQLLFRYINSLPTMHFISSFERGSNTLTELLISKADTGNLQSKDFAVAYCRALIMVARGHGPEILSNRSLRLRAYMLAQKAEVKEITSTASKALKLEAAKSNDASKTIKVVLSEDSSIQKITNLSSLSGKDAEFATAYYLAQLSKDEQASEEVLVIQLKQSLFGKPKNLEKALSTIARLPAKTAKSAKIQTLLGLAHYFDENPELAIKTLSSISTKTGNQEMQKWRETANSLANGIQFIDGRKKLFLEATEKAFQKFEESKDSLMLELAWQNKSDGESSAYQAFLGISKEKQSFEIQLQDDGKTIFAYRADQEKASLFSSEMESIIAFQSSGAIPVPNFNILRNPDNGEFNFNFNLNFAPSSDKLFEQGNKFLENPYIGTNKGREVLFSYITKHKGVWLNPSAAISGGNSYSLSLLNPDQPKPTDMEIVFDLSNNLKSLKAGNFTLSGITFGDSSILTNLPAWPETKIEESEKFDFPLLLKIIKVVSDLVAS